MPDTLWCQICSRTPTYAEVIHGSVRYRLCQRCYDHYSYDGRPVCPGCGLHSYYALVGTPTHGKLCSICAAKYKWEPRVVAGEPEKTWLYGVELEVGFENPVAYEYGVQIVCNLPMDVGSDGSIRSLYGREFRLYPMSAVWLQHHRDDINTFLTTLKSQTGSSGHAQNCGMHVHVSNYFTQAHLLRLLKIVYSNPRQMHWLSERADSDFHWAHLYGRETATSIDQFSPDKYEAVNIASYNVNNTIELRLFSGTLDVLSFWKNLELVQALIDFTTRHVQKSWRYFVSWVFKQKTVYPNLVAWMIEHQSSNEMPNGKHVFTKEQLDEHAGLLNRLIQAQSKTKRVARSKRVDSAQG